MDEINEVIIEEAVKPISLEKTRKILKQMESCVCKMYIEGKKGTGFFMKIPYKNDSLKVLITNNHVLNDNDIDIGKTITFSLNNDKPIINIKIKENMKRYTNEILDITIIELKDNDNINNFLDLDEKIKERINSENNEDETQYNNLFMNQSIYILSYIDQIYSSYGLLTKISGDTINHKCSTEEGASGSPILSLESNSVIGVHRSGTKYNLNINYGTLILKSLIEFQQIKNNLLVIKDPKKSIARNSSDFINNDNQDNLRYNNYNVNLSPISGEQSINESIINPNETQVTMKGILNISFGNLNETQTQITSNNFNRSQNNNNFHEKLLKYLIKFLYFKKEFKSQENLYQQKLVKAYLINKKVINKLKLIYNLDEIIPSLDDKILKGISYRNFEENYYKILEYLSEAGIDQSYTIEQNEFQGENGIEFNNEEKIIIPKNSIIPIKFKYLDDFEIIDKKFGDFLKLKFEGITMPLVHFGLIKNNNIFLIINLKEQYFHQIMSLNKEDNLTFKYSIEIVKDIKSISNCTSNNFIFGVLLKYDLKNLIKLGNPIKLKNGELILGLYSNCNSPKQKKNKSLNKQNNSPIKAINIKAY